MDAVLKTLLPSIILLSLVFVPVCLLAIVLVLAKRSKRRDARRVMGSGTFPPMPSEYFRGTDNGRGLVFLLHPYQIIASLLPVARMTQVRKR